MMPPLCWAEQVRDVKRLLGFSEGIMSKFAI